MPSASRPTQAFLLRAIDYSDSDRILTFYTKEEGRLSAIARRAKQSKRRFSGALEPYALVDITLRKTRGALDSLGEARVIQAFPNILQDLSSMRSAGTALAVVRELTPEHSADLRVFQAIHLMLEAMHQKADPSSVLIAFCVRVLALVGFPPALDNCAGCGRRPLDDQAALFSPAAGSIRCRACGGGAIRLAASTRHSWLRAQGEEWVPQKTWDPLLQEESLQLMIAFGDHHVGSGLRRTLDKHLL